MPGTSIRSASGLPPSPATSAAAGSTLSTPTYMPQWGGTPCCDSSAGSVIAPATGISPARVNIEYGIPRSPNGVIVQPTTDV